MPNWSFERNVTSMGLMTELAVECGLTRRRVLAGTGVAESQLADPEHLVSGEQELRQIRNLLDALGDPPGLGLWGGQRYHFTAFGVLGLAIMSSQTPREALEVALQHFALTPAFTTFRVEDDDTCTRVVLDDTDVPAEVRRFMVERDSAAFVTVMRDLFSFAPVLQGAQFRFARPSDSAAYEKIFGVEPLFEMPRNVLLLNRALLSERLPLGNQLALAAAHKQCRELLEARRARAGVAAKVRSLLGAQSTVMPDMPATASALFMTVRTLRRRLEEERTTYTELRAEVRQMLAEELLQVSHLSIEQIAVRLGYAESTSFISAFRRRHGQTPHAFRRAFHSR